MKEDVRGSLLLPWSLTRLPKCTDWPIYLSQVLNLPYWTKRYIPGVRLLGSTEFSGPATLVLLSN